MLKKICSVFLAAIMMMSLVISASAEIFFISTYEEGNMPAKNVVIAQGHAFVVCGEGDKPDTINIYELSTNKLVTSLALPVYTTGKNYFVEGIYPAGEYMYISWNRSGSSGDPAVRRYSIADMLSGKLEHVSGHGVRGDKQSCLYDNKLFYTDPKVKILYYINTEAGTQHTVMSIVDLDQAVWEKELVTLCADADLFYMVFPNEIRVYKTENMYQNLMQKFDETVAVYKTDETILDAVLYDDRLYVMKADGMDIMTVDTNELSKLGSYKEGGKIMAFTPKNATAYVYADGAKSIQILNIADPANVSVVDEVKINNQNSLGVAAIALDGQRIYAADLTDGFSMYSLNELDKFETTKKAESYAEELEMSEYGKAIELIVGLDIMGLRETGLFAPDSYITRGEFANAAAKLLGKDANGAFESKAFSDVPADSKYAWGINALSSAGIISGFSDGTFRPDEAMVFDHAIAVMLKIMGYYPIVQGTNRSALLVAADIDILDKVVSMGKNNISRGAAAKLIYNALNKQTVALTSFGEGSSYDEYAQNGTLLEKMNIKKAKGRVTATEFTSVSGDAPARDGRVIINGESYLEGASGAASYLGRSITFYYRYDDEGLESEIIYVIPTADDDDIIRVDAQNVSPLTTKTVFAYNNENDKLVKESIKNASIIFNGKFLKKYTAADLVPDDGEVVILDSDSDGEIDALIITSYETYIIDAYGRGVFKPMYGYDEIDLAKIAQTAKKTAVIVDGHRYDSWKDATGIKRWSVISVLRSRDNDICEIYVTNSQVPAMLTGFENDNAILDDTSYELSKVYNKNLSKPGSGAVAAKIGDDVFACLDVFGKIAAFKVNNLDAQYGYLMACGDEDEYEDYKTFYRILVRDENYIFGTIQLFEGTEKIAINGERIKNVHDVTALWKDGKTKKQIVKFVLNHDGKIKELYTAKDRVTAKDNPDYIENYKGYDEFNFTYDAKLTKGNAYRTTLGTFEGEPFTKNASTALFLIPSSDTAEEKDYKIMDAQAMFYTTTTLERDAHFYDINENYVIGAIVLKTDSTSKPIDVVQSSSNIIVIDTFIKGLNEDGETRYMVQSAKDADGKQKKEIIADEKLVDETGGIANDKYLGMKMIDLPKGSVVQYAKDGFGEIAAIRILYIPEKDSQYFEFALPRKSESYLGMTFYTTYAKIIKKTSGNRLIFNGNNTSILKDANGKAVIWDGNLETADHKWDRNLGISSVSNVFAFDKNEKKLTQITIGDLLPEDDILLIMRNSKVQMIVVYR